MTILIVTNTNDPTADFVIAAFSKKAIPFVRLNTDVFLSGVSHQFSVASGDVFNMDLHIGDKHINLSDIRSVWLRRPEEPIPDPRITNAQAQAYCVTEANYLLKCIYMLLEQKIWVSHPRNIAYSNVKLHQLELARSLGLLVPRTLCTNNPDAALEFITSVRSVVVKPFKANTLETDLGTAVIYTSRVGEDAIKNIASVSYAPTLFQEEIAKVKEYRVTIIGQEVFVTSIDSQSDPKLRLDWRNSSDKPKSWSIDTLPDEIIQKCFAMVKAYGLNYGAIDFALTPNGEIVFFELNPNGQWAWQEIDLGLPMTAALIRTLGY